MNQSRAPYSLIETSSTIRLALLGGLSLSVGDEPIALPTSAGRLVAYVALASPDRVLREQVAGELWPEASETRALANLRSTLWRVRKVCEGLVASSDRALRLADHVWLDTRDELELVGSAVDVRTRLAHAMSPLLPGWYDDWVIHERERLRQRGLHAVEAASRSLIDLGSHVDALDLAYRAIAAEPLRETPHQLVIECHLSQGNLVEARRHFDSYVHMLDLEMGVAPSEKMAQLLDEAVTLQRRRRDMRGARSMHDISSDDASLARPDSPLGRTGRG